MMSVQQMINKRIDDMIGYSWDHGRRVDQVRNGIDQLRNKIYQMRSELSERIYALNNSLGARIDVTNERIDRLYDVVVRREEHEELKKNLHAFNRRLKMLEEKIGVI